MVGWTASMDCTCCQSMCVGNTGAQDWYLTPCVCEDGDAHYDKMQEESIAAGVLNADGTPKAEHPATSKPSVKEERVVKPSRGAGKKRKADEVVDADNEE